MDDAEWDDVLPLQFLHHSVEDACLAPSFEAHVDGVPVAVLRRELPPRTSRAEQEQDGVEKLAVGICRRPVLFRQQRLDCCVLFIREHIYADG